MVRFLLAFSLLLSVFQAQAQYSETFSTPNKGYQLSCANDVAGVNWTLTPWDASGTCQVADLRDPTDYFQTTAGGVLESIDIDQEVCWVSPLLNISAAGVVTASVGLVWNGFDTDIMAGTCAGDYIKVLYSVNGGPYTMVPNQFGGNACATIAYPLGSSPPSMGTGTVTQGGISGTTLQIKVCVFTNANAELVQIDNVIVPQAGVTLNCSQPVLTATVKNIVCNGPNSGSIDLSVSGGTPGYTYAWAPGGATTQDISGLAVGTYTVTVTDAAMCSQTTSATIANSPITQSAVTSPASCGQANGTINLSASGGNPGYTYAWSNGPATMDITAAAGTYTVTITDASSPGCTSSAPYTIAAAANGPYNETFSVANKGYQINQVNDFFGVNWTLAPWTFDEPPAGIGRDNGDYFQTTAGGKLETLDTDMEVCWISPEINTSTSGTFLFSVDLAWTQLDPEDYINIKYSLNGGAFITVPNAIGGGGGTIQYASGVDISSAGNLSVTGLTANKIQIKLCVLTNSQGDIVSFDNVFIPQTVSLCFGPDVSTMATNVSCNGGNNGSIKVTASNATPPYNVSWSGPSSGNPAGTEIAASGGMYTITGLVAGTYTITVTDASSMTSTASVTLTQPSAITATTSATNVLCNGASTGAVNLTVSGGAPGYTFIWAPGGQTTEDLTNVPAGVYNVTVTDANMCTKTATATITEPSAIVLTTTFTNACGGGSNGTIDLTVSGGAGGYTYDWSNDGPETPDNDPQDLSGLSANTYTVTVTDASGCTKTTSATVGSFALPTCSITGPDTVCTNVAGNMYSATAGMTSYAWSIIGNGSIVGATNGQTVSVTAGPTAGATYSVLVTITNSDGCSSTCGFSASVNPSATVNAGGDVFVCQTDGSFPALNGVIGGSATSAIWSGGAGTFMPNANTLNATYVPSAAELAAHGTVVLTLTTNNPAGVCNAVSDQLNYNIGFAATVNAGVDQTVCASSPAVQLAATFGGATTSVVWDINPPFGTFNPGDTDPTAIYTPTAGEIAAGTVLMTIRTNDPAGACPLVSDQMVITINPAATVNAGQEVFVCQTDGSFPALSGAIGGAATSATWSGGTGTFTPNASTLNATYVPSAAELAAHGTVVLTLTTDDPAGPCGAVSAQLNYNIGFAAIVNAGVDQTVCASSPAVQLAATFGGATTSVVWDINPPFGAFNPGDTDPTAIYTPTAGEIAAGTVLMTIRTNDPAGACPLVSDQMVITISPTPNAVATPPSQTICSGSSITTIVLSGSVANTTFNWTRDNTGTVTGIAASGSGNISGALTNTTNAPITVTFTITPTAANCTGAPITATVIVNPTPNAVATPSSQTICSGGTITTIALSGNVANTTFNWTRDNTGTVTGIAANGSGNISGALTNTTNAPVTVTFTITPTANGCPGTAITATVIVNPTPNAVATPASQTICSAGTITTIALSGNVANTSFNWTRDNTGTVTGIAASGSGDISGALTNTTNAPVTVTFTITPTANGCPGAAITATVIVNPTPNAVATPASQTICSAGTITTIVLSGNVANTTFNWTRDNTGTVTGIAANGSGNISGALTNTTNAPITVTFTITPTANGCPGAAITATVIVNPTPNAVATPASQTICSGGTITTIVLSGNVANTTYNWTRNNTGTVTGIAASGSGNISGALTNTTNAPITVTFTITPTANGCPGTPITATVLVNPLPDAVATPSSQTICSGNTITPIVLTGTVAGTVFNWTRNNTATVTGIAANGVGNISGALTNTTNAPITVTFTIIPTANGCSPGAPTLATVLVNPTPLPFTVTGGGGYCIGSDPGAPVGLSGSQTNVNYQLKLNNVNVGAPLAGTGAALNFGFQNGVGTYTVVATHTQGACTNTMTGTVTVFSFNCSATISDPCVCLNNATTLTNGQFGEQIKINAPSNQVWTVTAINGLYSTTSLAPPSAPTPITIGTVLANIGGNMFTLDGRHIDAIGYTISVSNGIGTTLSIGNSCQYPNPSITSDLSGDFCLYTAPVTLTGNPGDANIASQGFTVNGVAATTFNPSAGVGQYTIVYTVDGGAPKAAGPNDPGCIQKVSQIVNVVATPSQLACNDLVYVSLDVDCITEVLPDDILEGTYGCFDDYTVTITGINGVPNYGNTVTAANVGQTLKATVKHLVSGVSCWGLIKVEDKLAPEIECADITLNCAITNYDPSYLFNTLGIANAYPDVTDCSSYTVTYTDTWHDLLCGQGFNGQQDLSAYVVRKWVAKDAWGNEATCTQYIYFKRRHVSDVLFPLDATVSCGPNVNTDPSNTGAPYITGFGQNWPLYPGVGFCELSVAYTDQILPVCDGTYKILRTWVVLDWCITTSTQFPTNPVYYIQLIKVIDDLGPNMSCPANLTVSTDPFNCCVTTDLPNIVISDNCSRINNIEGDIITYDPQTGAQTGTYEVGGTLTTFPGNNLWNPDTLGNWGYTSCLHVGTHTVIYTAQDDCGNTSTCSFKLSVRDYIPPVAACTEFTTVAIGPDDPFDHYEGGSACDFGGVTWVPASVFDQGSDDNCNNVAFTVRRMDPYSDCINSLDPDFEKPIAVAENDSIKFYCCEVGTTQTVILRVYQVDYDGNIMNGADGSPIYNECMIQVEVQDKIKPVCISPANVTVSCENFDPSLWVYGKPVIADNCCLDTSKVYQTQCGLTHSANYNLFDTVCNRGTITRTFRAFDCHGQSSQCTQRIIVNYEQDYFVKFPNDVIVTICDGTGNYGEPTFFGEDCELLASSYTDEIFTVVPDACFKIERTWKVINWCTYNPNLGCIYVQNPSPNATTNHPSNLPGPIVSACGTPAPWNPTVVKINASDAQATNYCTFWDANANCYVYKQIIKIIDTKAPTTTCPASPVTFCDVTPNNPQLWNEMYWWDNTIQSHDLCEGPSDLTITASDACSGANINIEYLLFLDLDGNGSMETVISSTNLPGINNVYFNNATNPNFGGGTPRQFDERPVPFNQQYGFTIQETTSGVNKTAAVRWNTLQSQTSHTIPELPYGTHKIKWIMSDGCGNESVCEYQFIVKDCKKPTVVCLNGLSVNIMPTQMIQLWASDFLQYTEDNCTPSAQIKIGIVKSSESTGVFPVDANGNPITNVVFTCAELGTQPVQLWAIDAAGNADYCETYVIVQDNAGNCSPNAKVSIAGALKTEANQGLEDASIDLQGQKAGIPDFSQFDYSDQDGHYEFLNTVPMASNVTVTPVEDDNHINGVSTFDLVLISKHILGLEPLTSPYKMIAADVNKSGSITTFDIVELRKLILGIYLELPNNTSWRFVDQSYVFPTPSNPFQMLFPENKTISAIQSNQMDVDFVAIKIGDINGNAIPNNLISTEDRGSGSLLFDVQDRAVKAGEEFDVTFKASEQVQGYQFTMNFPGLEVVNIVPGINMTMDNFAVFAGEKALTTSFDQAKNAPAGETISFTVRFKATKSGLLSNMLSVSSSITKAEAYVNVPGSEGETPEVSKLEVAFRFTGANGSTISGVGFELYQNQPNPFVNQTTIGFHLPQATKATLSVYDETGRLILTQQGDFARGYNQIAIEKEAIEVAGPVGMLYYRLDTATDTATRKMVRSK